MLPIIIKLAWLNWNLISILLVPHHQGVEYLMDETQINMKLNSFMIQIVNEIEILPALRQQICLLRCLHLSIDTNKQTNKHQQANREIELGNQLALRQTGS